MKTFSSDEKRAGESWPPGAGEKIAFAVKDGVGEGIVRQVRWGIAWRDFILEDGRVVPEHKLVGCPDPPIWRDPDSVSAEERRRWEDRLIAMGEASVDPHDRDQEFWADLTQYLAYTYLKAGKGKITDH